MDDNKTSRSPHNVDIKVQVHWMAMLIDLLGSGAAVQKKLGISSGVIHRSMREGTISQKYEYAALGALHQLDFFQGKTQPKTNVLIATVPDEHLKAAKLFLASIGKVMEVKV